LKIRAHVYVSGRVQGVFFRSETEYEAVKRNVCGWVRNLSNGRVEAVFEGERTVLEELVEFCRRGPRGSRVSEVEIHWEEYTGEFKSFRIRYGYL